jgi:hypothetical protein
MTKPVEIPCGVLHPRERQAPTVSIALQPIFLLAWKMDSGRHWAVPVNQSHWNLSLTSSITQPLGTSTQLNIALYLVIARSMALSIILLSLGRISCLIGKRWDSVDSMWSSNAFLTRLWRDSAYTRAPRPSASWIKRVFEKSISESKWLLISQIPSSSIELATYLSPSPLVTGGQSKTVKRWLRRSRLPADAEQELFACEGCERWYESNLCSIKSKVTGLQVLRLRSMVKVPSSQCCL